MTGKREYDALRDINRSRAHLDATRFDTSERMTALVTSLLLQLFFARHCCNSVCLFPLRQHKEHTRAATTQLECSRIPRNCSRRQHHQPPCGPRSFQVVSVSSTSSSVRSSCRTGCGTSVSLYKENREPSLVRVKRSRDANPRKRASRSESVSCIVLPFFPIQHGTSPERTEGGTCRLLTKRILL